MSERTEMLRQELQEARDALLAAIDQTTEADLAKPTLVDSWTVKDVVAHLAYNQPSQPRLIRNILEGKGGTPSGFDLNYYNRRGIEKQQAKSVEQLKADLAAGHSDTLNLLGGLTDADLDKMGSHASAGYTTIEQIFRIVARHDTEHTEHIRQALGK